MRWRFVLVVYLFLDAATAMFNKRSKGYDASDMSPSKRLRCNLADLFLSNTLPGDRTQSLFDDAAAASARGGFENLQSRNDIDKGDPRIFGGVYVVGVVTLWALDNEWGKRINASLEAVQYARTGKSFGSPPLNIDDAFDDLPEEDDAEEEEAPAPAPVKAPAKAKAPAKVAVEIEDEREDEAFT